MSAGLPGPKLRQRGAGNAPRGFHKDQQSGEADVGRRLACPHCTKPIPRHWLGDRQFLCTHCRAPVRFRWPLRAVTAVISAALMVLLIVLLRPLWAPFAAYTEAGHLDRGSLTNFAIMGAHILPALFIGEVILHRFGSLTLANPNWPLRLSVADRKLMRRYGISSNGEYFAVDELHFDSLQRAVEHARANERQREG